MADKPSNTRITPDWLVDLARRAMGGIDVDPCTIESNPVGAKTWFTKERPAPVPLPDGKMWCNPPWGRGEIIEWARLFTGRPYGELGLFLTPADPRTNWFKHLRQNAEHLLLITESVKFWAPEVEKWVEPSRGCFLWTQGRVNLGLLRSEAGVLVVDL